MKEPCKFCGEEVKDEWKEWDRLKCESARYNSDGTFETFYSRTLACYERQLAQQAELIGWALRVLNRVEFDKELSPGPFCDLHADIRAIISALEDALNPKVNNLHRGI